MKPFYLLAFCIILTAACGPAPQPSLMEMEEWDLLWISDSSGWDVARVYAAMVAEDTGITIDLHDNWIGGLAAADVLRALQGEETQSFTLANLADEIREAEIIVFYANPEGSWRDDNPADWYCIGASGNYVNNCDMSTFDTYIADLEAIYQLIFELRDGQPTIIRAYDAYTPRVVNWQADGCFDACHACWDNYNAAIRQAAATYNIPVADVYAAWNGADGTLDPVERGYTKDNVHPNELGARLIAEAVRATGYDPVIP